MAWPPMLIAGRVYSSVPSTYEAGEADGMMATVVTAACTLVESNVVLEEGVDCGRDVFERASKQVQLASFSHSPPPPHPPLLLHRQHP